MNPLIPPINTADSLFHDGNPATGELGTIVSAEWLNNMQGALRGNQSELIALLTAAGIEPSAAKADQVLTALRGLFLGKTAQAADSAKLEGHPANYFAKADDLAKISGDPLLWPRTSPSRTNIQAGYAPLDGQELSRALYPDAWAAIQAGAVPVVTEAEWLADPLKRGAWTYGNGSTTFRMPDWNGKSAGSKGAVFVRGDGALSTGTPGRMQSDGVGTVAAPTRSANYTPTWGTVYLSSKSTLSPGITLPDEPGWNGIIGAVPGTVERVNMVNLGSTDTRPLNVAGVWVCRLFGVVTNPGAADAAQLATEVARLWAQKLELSAFSGSNQLLADTGYQRLPGGLIVQWGGVPASATSIVFPVVFPGAALKVILQADIGSTGAIAGTDVKVATKTVTGFTRPAGVIAAGIYFAIGY
ncbi:phage tail protein [Laribacter hongkongensis]|uniref:phage tail protein n=1 Tax=Laribacter hongkongensis TaxID=168471 RepID=UPI001EFD2A64|nr:phage tail protein [Laribacter hongkongensis]MCG8996412.1 phage tail protein [Laribacter hongkongensis]MCG9011769.1 phage tail protein [Laribacter hongkongensis]MCG9048375.1 phage tail protein [Laribacter hongkongensis]MCG9075217.1 phage tail protein [Laribacter hongkongensis]